MYVKPYFYKIGPSRIAYFLLYSAIRPLFILHTYQAKRKTQFTKIKAFYNGQIKDPQWQKNETRKECTYLTTDPDKDLGDAAEGSQLAREHETSGKDYAPLSRSETEEEPK